MGKAKKQELVNKEKVKKKAAELKSKELRKKEKAAKAKEKKDKAAKREKKAKADERRGKELQTKERSQKERNNKSRARERNSKKSFTCTVRSVRSNNAGVIRAPTHGGYVSTGGGMNNHYRGWNARSASEEMMPVLVSRIPSLMATMAGRVTWASAGVTTLCMCVAASHHLAQGWTAGMSTVAVCRTTPPPGAPAASSLPAGVEFNSIAKVRFLQDSLGNKSLGILHTQCSG